MLYADSYLTRDEFHQMFDHSLYNKMRDEYKCYKAFPEVYDKVNRTARNWKENMQTHVMHLTTSRCFLILGSHYAVCKWDFFYINRDGWGFMSVAFIVDLDNRLFTTRFITGIMDNGIKRNTNVFISTVI